MFVHCLKLCQLLGRRGHPHPWFSLFFILGWLSPCRQQSKEVTPLYSTHVSHAWIFSFAGEFLSPCQPSKSSRSWVATLSPGSSEHRLPPGWVFITSGAGMSTPYQGPISPPLLRPLQGQPSQDGSFMILCPQVGRVGSWCRRLPGDSPPRGQGADRAGQGIHHLRC